MAVPPLVILALSVLARPTQVSAEGIVGGPAFARFNLRFEEIHAVVYSRPTSSSSSQNLSGVVAVLHNGRIQSIVGDPTRLADAIRAFAPLDVNTEDLVSLPIKPSARLIAFGPRRDGRPVVPSSIG